MGWFSDIPLHNQMDILKKLDNFKEFVKFKKSSQESLEITKDFNYLLPLRVDYMTFNKDSIVIEVRYSHKHDFELILGEPVRLDAQQIWVNSTISKNSLKIEEICQKNGLTTEKLQVDKNQGDLDAETIDGLIELLQVDQLNLSNYSSADFIGLTEFNKLEAVYFFNGELREADFLRLATLNTSVHKAGLSHQAVNKFLKQWNAEKREIEELMVIPMQDYLLVFENLNFSLIWSVDPSEDTPYSHVELDIHPRGEALLKVYMVEMEGDGKRLLVGISHWDKIRITAKEIEEDEDIEEWIRWNYE